MNNSDITRHIKTHSARSADDRAAVNALKYFISSDRIAEEFYCNDKWPNVDGYFELADAMTKKPQAHFAVQIKGTNHCEIKSDGSCKYLLKSLAFPAYVFSEITLDPTILFVIINPEDKGNEHIYWKYLSAEFLNRIDYSKDSFTIDFDRADELLNTKECVNAFADKLIKLYDNNLFVKKLISTPYTEAEALRLIKDCNERITEAIEKTETLNETRDNISRRMLSSLEDLCSATLLLNAIKAGYRSPDLRLAWELSLLNNRTQFLSDFLQMIRYVGRKIPEEGQSERLMLKYYDYLWAIKVFLKGFGVICLENLEKFPLKQDEENKKYYEKIAKLMGSAASVPDGKFGKLRYYVENKKVFYVNSERYYELTLQLAGKYASKFNRVTVYTKLNISTPYSIRIAYDEEKIEDWNNELHIKILKDWKVSVDPSIMNSFAGIFGKELKLSANFGEYDSLMAFLTRSGMSLLDLIDIREEFFDKIISDVYYGKNTAYFCDILKKLRADYSKKSRKKGKNTLRYVLLRLREEVVESVLPTDDDKGFQSFNDELFLSSKCIPFERNPLLSNLPKTKSNKIGSLSDLVRVVDKNMFAVNTPYLRIKGLTEQTGEIYIDKDEINYNGGTEDIERYNASLTPWEREQGFEIKKSDEDLYIESYERYTVNIMKRLIEYTLSGNQGQKQLNKIYVKEKEAELKDPIKKSVVENAFTKSKLLLIYGAAGTGKTTLMNHMAGVFGNNRRKLFLAGTHSAKANLEQRIKNQGANDEFMTVESFIKDKKEKSFDCVFIDECSTIDNRHMSQVLEKLDGKVLLVLAGDIYQIESIDFGNWFYYAREIIDKQSVAELTNTWRTHNPELIDLWEEVRKKGKFITEKLAIKGPYSKEIYEGIFKRTYNDCVVLCLNYDGRFGLNNINNYFQENNKSPKIMWHEWAYKEGDPILFNDNQRFRQLYNNLKGRILKIEKDEFGITFDVRVMTVLTGNDVSGSDITVIDVQDDATIIRFTVYESEGGSTKEERDDSKMRSVVPFQVAYAVSIHKAQGLEYDEVKVIVPGNNIENISHGIFYTAITRAKKKLTIYWSPETMESIVKGFYTEENNGKSLEKIVSKLKA